MTQQSPTDTDNTELNTKYLFVTGGVMSGLGKGLTAASIGRLLIDAGLSVTAIKVDPYINVDAGTMNPIEHGEVYVLEDGGEVDLDLGNYERFLNESMERENNLTTGKIYKDIINQERSGDYLGKTVQIIPHVTDEIQNRFKSVPDDTHDVCIVEIGGTVGDIEAMHFLEAVRQFIQKHNNKAALCHTTLIPHTIGGEQKTKPTQHSVKELRSLGMEPNMVVGRCSEHLHERTKEKIAMFCDVDIQAVFSNPDVDNIYNLPKVLRNENIREYVLGLLSLNSDTTQEQWGSSWSETVAKGDSVSDNHASIAIVGKYDLDDAYLSIHEALEHSSFKKNTTATGEFIDSETLEDNSGEYDMETIADVLASYDGVIVPGGFGERGTEGKIGAIRYCRENSKPYLGICFGMQLAVVEYARNVCGLESAHSSEINEETTHPVVTILPDQHDIEDMGGTMRLGNEKSMIKEDTIAEELYGDFCIERHRHRYEINPEYIDLLERNGLMFSGTKNKRMEIAELNRTEHPFFFGTQFHPEFTSRPNDTSPVFDALLDATTYRLNTSQ